MSKVNQIIMKAFSSDSEDEAVSCFLMARKQFKKESTDVNIEASQKFNGKTAREWYDIATVIQRTSSVILDRQKETNNSTLKLHGEIHDLRKKIIGLETSNLKLHVNYILGFAFAAVMFMILI